MTLDDDELRAALREEAGRVQPEPDAWHGVAARFIAPARGRWLWAAAAVSVAIVGAAVGIQVLGDDDSGRPVTADTGPDAVTTMPLPTTSTTRVPPGPRPSTVVGVDEHGRLVVVNAETGAIVRELDYQADPTVQLPADAEIAPNVLCGVTRLVDGRVLYESCGEPAFGYIKLAAEGEPPTEYVADGGYVTESFDGRFATVAYGLAIYDSTTLKQLVHFDLPSPGDMHTAAWSPDTKTIAVVQGRRNDADRPQIVLVSTEDGSIRALPTPPDTIWGHPVFRSDGMLVVAERCCVSPVAHGPDLGRVVDPATGNVVGSFAYPGEVADQEYDATGTWLLTTLTDGRLMWRGGDESGFVPGNWIAADW
jgi:hypothetical protein